MVFMVTKPLGTVLILTSAFLEHISVKILAVRTQSEAITVTAERASMQLTVTALTSMSVWPKSLVVQ